MGRVSGILILSAIVLGCTGIAVKRDYDASVDFRRLKTYAWQSPAQNETGGDLADNSLVETRVQNAVNAALSEKGFKKGSAGEADCLVTYHYTVEKLPAQDQVSSGISVGMGSGGAFGGLGIGLGSAGREEERETLTIDVLDPQSGKLMWRGFAQQPLERLSDPKKAAASINAFTRAILSKFPPRS